LSLAEDEVHVWQLTSEGLGEDATALASLLSAPEQARAARFHFERDRANYTLGRGGLRLLLGAYLRRSPRELACVEGPFGTPALRSGSVDEAQPEFNVSHSGQVILIAVGRGASLGVDVERVRLSDSNQEIADRFCAPAEAAQLRRLAGDEQAGAFARLWTRKEALVKATGRGLSFPFAAFEVPIGPLAREGILVSGLEAGQTHRWWLTELSMPAGYVAALARQEAPASVSSYTFGRSAQAPGPTTHKRGHER
jgi:4'-phosphopantetheinyl transferase